MRPRQPGMGDERDQVDILGDVGGQIVLRPADGAALADRLVLDEQPGMARQDAAEQPDHRLVDGEGGLLALHRAVQGAEFPAELGIVHDRGGETQSALRRASGQVPRQIGDEVDAGIDHPVSVAFAERTPVMHGVGVDEAEIVRAGGIVHALDIELLAAGDDGADHIGFVGVALIDMGAEQRAQAFEAAIARLAPEPRRLAFAERRSPYGLFLG